MNSPGKNEIVAIATVLLLVTCPSLLAQTDMSCTILCRSTWLESEQFAWLRLCSGQSADFNSRAGEALIVLDDANCWDEGLDPSRESCWSDSRTIRSQFLRDILFDETLKKALEGRVVHIVGGYFNEAVDLNYRHIKNNLFLDRSRFSDTVSMAWIRADRNISFDRSVVEGILNLEGARIDGSLWLREGKYSESPKSIRLGHAKVRGQLSMAESRLQGVDMDSISIGDDLFLRDTTIVSTLSLIFANVESNVVLDGAKLHIVDMSGATFDGDLRMADGRRNVQWRNGGSIYLLNTHVGALVESPTSWPGEVRSEGFTYNQLGGFGSSRRDVVSKRGVGQYSWLGRGGSGSLHPYEHLAAVLRKAGNERVARDVLFHGRKSQRKQASSEKRWLTWGWLTLLQSVIGYGYRLSNALWWCIGVIVIGCFMAVLQRKCGDNRKTIGPIGFWFSVDYLLPIIELNVAHFEGVTWKPMCRWYFYAHRLIGYVLMLFVVAALTGLVK